MVILIAILAAGILVGFLCPSRVRWPIPRLITVVIWALLFLLGYEIGDNPLIMQQLGSLGVLATILSVAGVLGSVLMAFLLWRVILRRQVPAAADVGGADGGVGVAAGGSAAAVGGSAAAVGGSAAAVGGSAAVVGGSAAVGDSAAAGGSGVVPNATGVLAAGGSGVVPNATGVLAAGEVGFGDRLADEVAGAAAGGSGVLGVASASPNKKKGPHALAGSLIMTGFFFLGVCAALLWNAYISQHDLVAQDASSLVHGLPHRLSMYVLYVLIFLVGMTMGHDRQLFHHFRTLNPRFFLLPLFTAIGTYAAMVGVGLATTLTIPNTMAIGSGFAYYSLSSVLIGQYEGAFLGTLALLTNVMRELITLLGAPLLVRVFGPLAPISAGGATTMDTTLPVIITCSGSPYAVVSIVHAMVLDFSVPFLVTFFCGLG